MEVFTYKIAENDKELEDGMGVRRRVFVGEQGIPENLVFDGRDDKIMQIVVKREEMVVGTARVRFLESGEAKVERMAILLAFRQMGVGKRMVSFLAGELQKRHFNKVVLHAQYEVVEFYQSCGFETVGAPFLEAGIKHILMERGL